MYDVCLSQVCGVFLDAFLQRCGCESCRGFYLNGRNVVTAGYGLLGDEEINLHPVVFVFARRVRIEEKFAAESSSAFLDLVYDDEGILRHDVHTGMSRKGADDTRDVVVWFEDRFGDSSSFAYISLFIQQKFGRIFSQNQQKIGR